MHSDWLPIKGASWAWTHPKDYVDYSASADKDGKLILEKSELAEKVLANDAARTAHRGKKSAQRALASRWAKGASA
jgi:hypothetical protein